ncbi:MAG: glycerophosphodiester phosphodiesterase [Clostridia bacterium]|nr:glycerophosphodiester phosphodiesterase [Clostridia bacterium]
MTKVWAHRGASAYAPENTIPAFKLAVEMGADGVELDVHESKDGKLMVIHDETVDRTSNGTGRVVDMTCQELKTLDFSNGMEAYAGVRIPTLKEVYGLLRNTGLSVNVEIKCDVIVYWGIWEKLLQTEQEMGMQGRVHYSSFNHYVLRELQKLEPEAATGLLFNQALLDPWVYAGYCKAQAIHPHYRIVTECPGLLEGCRKANIDINAWTVNDVESMKLLRDEDVNAIITNMPDVARRVIG